jgi:hypothetical protein
MGGASGCGSTTSERTVNCPSCEFANTVASRFCGGRGNAQNRGDSIEVYFGYPHAREDDASRVVSCALDKLDAIRQLANDQVRSPSVFVLADEVYELSGAEGFGCERGTPACTAGVPA